MIRKLSLWLQAGFYILGGINHFINPEFYIDMIPPYFVYLDEINLLAGVAEIVLGAGLLFNKTRKLAAYGIILMLVAFVPAHVYFIQIGGCIEGGLCAPEWMGWLRLLLIQPLLIIWAWTASK